MTLIVFLVGILSGVALRSIIVIPVLLSLAFCVASSISYLHSRSIIFLFICCASIGVLRFEIAETSFQNNISSLETRKSITFNAIIDEIPVESDRSISARSKTHHGYVMLRLEKGSDVMYGDKLSVTAQCEIPKDFETNTGTMFDYDRYLMARGMHHICIAKDFRIIEKNAGNYIKGALYKLRKWFSLHIDEAFRNPHAGLIKGIVLGDKDGLTTELKSDMTIAGVIHIAVLSGSNIALVAAIVSGLSQSLSYNLRIVLAIVIVTLFVILSGAEPPAIRAGILISIMLCGKFIHRKLHTGRALLLIAFIMVMMNPFALIYDLSFQLSFLATIGIVYIAPVMEKVLHQVTEKYSFREILAVTLGAQIAVTPLLVYSTSSLSLVALPANILISWAVPVLMSLGFIAGILHAFSLHIAMPIVFLAELISSYIIFVTQLCAHASFAQILF